MKIEERIEWCAVAEMLPDSDETVLVYHEEAGDPVWLGFLDGSVWRLVDGCRLDPEPSHWARMPAGPGN